MTTPLEIGVTKTNSMGAFYSATDDANENATQFYGVWGKVNTKPEYVFRYCSGKTKQKISPDVLFEWPTIKTQIITKKTSEAEGFVPTEEITESFELITDNYPKVEYPADWMGQHTARKYVAPTRSYGSYGSAYSYGGYGGTVNGKKTSAGSVVSGGSEDQLSYDSYYDYANWYDGTGGMSEQEMAYHKFQSAQNETIAGGYGNFPGTRGMTGAYVTKAHLVDDEQSLTSIDDDVFYIASELEMMRYDEVIEDAIDLAKDRKEAKSKK